MEQNIVSSSAILLEDGLQAGWLMDGRGTNKEYAGFWVRQVDDENIVVSFRRTCTPTEKKKLAKLVFSDRCVKSIHVHTDKACPCQLFTLR